MKPTVNSFLSAVLCLLAMFCVLSLARGRVGFMLAVLSGALVGFAAEALLARRPTGWMAALGAGLVGAFMGSVTLGPMGPVVRGFAVAPGVLACILVVLVITVLARANPEDRDLPPPGQDSRLL